MNMQLMRARSPSEPGGPASIHVWPGRTLGGIFIGRYGTGSTLHYSELIAFQGIASSRGQIGVRISHIYVDSPSSVAGGREIWGLPKELAEFDWRPGKVTVRQHGAALIGARIPQSKPGFPVRCPLPAFGQRGGRLLHFTGRCRAVVSVVEAMFEIPRESPLANRGYGAGWSFALDRLQVVVPGPRDMGPFNCQNGADEREEKW